MGMAQKLEQMGHAQLNPGIALENCDKMSPCGRAMVHEPQPGEVTELLVQLRHGNREAEAKLVPLIYVELRRMAANYLHGERPDHTLQPTALVHEAYLRLINIKEVDWKCRSHFMATAATVMRRILVDHARAQRSRKRKAFQEAVSLDELLVVSPGKSDQLIALDDALDRLAKLDPRRSKIVELRFFGGLTEEETGALLGITARTVKRDWRVARAWLYNEVKGCVPPLFPS